MIRILFVDDDPAVLDGLRRVLHAKRSAWETAFASSGTEALARMDGETFDVVVSDMRMPGMDGAELLATIRERHPDAVRIILSAHSGREMVIRALGSAQQYLPKPCDPAMLQATIDRAASLRARLESDGIRRLVGTLTRIPSVPALYREINGALADPDATAECVADIVSHDMGMSSKLLALTNSAFFGLRERVTTVRAAVTLLGMETISSLVLGAGIFEEGRTVDIPGFSLDAIWKRSLRSLVCTRTIARAERVPRGVVDEATTAAVLQDVGQLVMAVNDGERYGTVVARACDGTSLPEAEMTVLGADHGTIGAYLLALWGLPDVIVDAVARHHEPIVLEQTLDVRALTHLGGVLAAESAESDPTTSEYLDSLRSEARLALWREACSAALSADTPA